MNHNLLEELQFNTNGAIHMIKELLNIDDREIASILGVPFFDVNNKEQINDLYNFCYNNNVYINEIIWQDCCDCYADHNTVILAHGSRAGIKGDIRLDVSGDSNDFGNGFYCGQSLLQAGMFIADEPESCIYIIKLSKDNLKPVFFKLDTKWLLAVGYYRKALNKYEDSPVVRSVIDDINNSDYVIAPIADNRMFQIIDEFTSGHLTDVQCIHALASTNLGYQYVFKNERCLDSIEILEKCFVCNVEKSFYNKESRIETNTSLNKSLWSRKKYFGKGKYINEIL